jgi:hypothetical protein
MQFTICGEKVADNPNLQYVRFKCLPKNPESWCIAQDCVSEDIGVYTESKEDQSQVIWLGQTSDRKKTNLIEDD